MVKFSNTANALLTSYIGGKATRFVAEVGAKACRKALTESGGVANAKTRAIGAASLAAIGLVAGYTINTTSALIKDNRLADEYEQRHK